MYCPYCRQRISDRARSCPYCGMPQPRRPRRGIGGGMLVFLLLLMVATTIWAESDGRWSSAALRAFGRAQAGPRGEPIEHENAARGHAVQVKEGDLGSAGLLRGDVMLVSLYIDDEENVWDVDMLEEARSCLDVACGYLEEEAAAYGEELELWYDTQAHPDLMYRAEYRGVAAKEDTRFSYWLWRWIDQNVPVAELQERYGTDNVGFLALVADEGGAYTNVFYVEDSTRYFNEISVLFYYYSYMRTTDREVPAVYAHEILHQFGAIDLYEDSPDLSPENIEYVARTYPDDIMYAEYVRDGRPDYEQIHLEISPITAYYLGWLEELPEADQEALSDYERVCVGGFSYDDPTFGDDED